MRALLAFGLMIAATPAAAEPLHFDNGRLFIDATVNGVDTEALLDSGAEASIIDPALSARAKLPEGTPQTIRGSGGETEARIVEGVTIRAVGAELQPEAVIVMDLSELSARLIKRPTQAIVGRELFDAARLEIDIAAGRIDNVSGGAAPPVGIRLPLTTHAGIESVPVTVNGRAASAEFDLGNGSGVLISRALANAMKLRPTGRKSGGGIGGAVDRDLVRLATLDVAGKRFRDVVAAIDDQPNANDLNIGTSILKHFIITTDFKQRSIWLRPTEPRER